jgi:hypothetical protein
MLDLAKNPNAISSADSKILARLGYSRKDIQDLVKARSKVEYDVDGRLVDWNMDKWDNGIEQKMRDSIYNNIESSVLHPDGATLPMLLTDPDSWVAKISLQFMRFPIDSYEKLFLRGMSEMQGKQVAGVVSNFMLWTMVLSFRDALKVEDKQRYNDDDGMLFQDALKASSMVSGPMTLLDKAYTATTGDRIGSDYSPGSSMWGGAAGNIATKLYGGNLSGIAGVVQGHISNADAVRQYTGKVEEASGGSGANRPVVKNTDAPLKNTDVPKEPEDIIQELLEKE